MKKSTKMTAAALVMGSLLIPSAFPSFAAEVNEAQARDIAIKHAGVSLEQVAFIHSEMDFENGRPVYEVEFYTKDYREFDYEIEISTGNILSFDYDTEYFNVEAARNQGRFLNGPMAAQTNPGQVKIEDAKTKALQHAGLSANQVTFVKTEIDYENGRQVYEIEFFTSDYREFDYEIDTETGEIVSYDFDLEYWQPPVQNVPQSTPQSSGAVTADKAKEIAAAQAGLRVSDVRFIKIGQDFDDGRLLYEGEFIHGIMEYEFEIDAQTGMIVEWDAESIYD